MTPLSSVKSACSLIQQEESQRELLESSLTEVQHTALYSRAENVRVVCSQCRVKGHA